MVTRVVRYLQVPWQIFAAATAIVLALSWGFAVRSAFAHGESVLTVTPGSVAAGETITVKAEGVEAGEVFTISLLGLNYEEILGEVTVGDDDDFHQEFIVPKDAAPGAYQVEAVSEEGETLVAELTVLEGETTVLPLTEVTQPSDENVQLERTRTTGQWLAISAAVLGSIGLGVFLIRSANSAENDE